MNKIVRTKAKTLIAALLIAVMLVPAAVFAGETSSLNIPVSVYVTGGVDTSQQREYTFRITPENDAPAPTNSEVVISELEPITAEDGTVSYKGKGYFSFDMAAFARPDDYSYVISQTTEADEKIKTLDDTEYNVTVRVLNEENGGTYAVWAEKNSESWNEEDGAKYDIEYQNELIPTPQPSGLLPISRPPSPTPSEDPDQSITPTPETPGGSDPTNGPSNPSGTPPRTDTTNPTSPKTGDESQTAFYFSILLASVAVVMITVKRKAKK